MQRIKLLSNRHFLDMIFWFEITTDKKYDIIIIIIIIVIILQYLILIWWKIDKLSRNRSPKNQIVLINKVLLYHFLLYKTYTVTVKTNNKSWFTSSQVHLNKTTITKKGKQNKTLYRHFLHQSLVNTRVTVTVGYTCT